MTLTTHDLLAIHWGFVGSMGAILGFLWYKDSRERNINKKFSKLEHNLSEKLDYLGKRLGEKIDTVRERVKLY